MPALGLARLFGGGMSALGLARLVVCFRAGSAFFWGETRGVPALGLARLFGGGKPGVCLF